MAGRFHRRSLRYLLYCLVTCCVLIAAHYSSADAPKPYRNGRFYEPVEVPGEILPAMLGKRIPELAVYSWKTGGWTPVLFQVDERTPDGNFVLTKGPEANPKAADGVFDKQDLVVFMAREAAEKAPEGESPPGADLSSAIELIDPLTGESSFAYLAWFKNGAPKNSLEPVSTLIDRDDEFNFRFPGHEWNGLINYREKKAIPTIYMDKLRIKPRAGGNGENIMDRQKVRGRITFIGGAMKVPISEKIVSGGVVAYKPGPVRILTHSCMYPLFPMGVKGPKFYIDAILVDTLSLISTKIDMPVDPGIIISDMTLALGMDLTPAAKGMRLYNSVNPGGVLIDGKMDDAERKFNTKKDKWRLITGPQGTQIISTDFDPRLLKDGSASTTYDDDESVAHPPENFQGDVGASFDQITIRKLPPGEYIIDVFGCIPYNFYNPNGLDQKYLDSIMKVKTDPLVIRTDAGKTVNRAGRPRMVRS